jgi:hypothetical protein
MRTWFSGKPGIRASTDIMRRPPLHHLVLRRVFLALALASGTAGAAENAPWSLVSSEAIRAHVDFLASDLLEGRAAASRGYDLAAAYVASQFRESSLAPGASEQSFYQSVPLLEATPVLPGSSAQLVVDDEKVSFEYSTHYLPSADFTAASSTLSAPLAFVGFGIEAPELNYNDFDHVDVKNKIAVVLSGAPAKFPHDQRAYYSWANRKWSTLAEHGAVGAVLVDSPDDLQRTPWERHVATSWVAQMRWLDDDGKPESAFPEVKLRFRFNHTAAAQLFERADTKLEQAMTAADAGEPQGFDLPGLLKLSATTGLRRTESANVIGVLRGSDRTLRDEYVVLTAHLDHLGRGSAVNGDSIYNGAHDNALGLSIMLEVARALAASGAHPKRSIVFAALTGEEKGLLGSDYLVQHAPFGGAIVADINLDMPMLFARSFDFIALGAEHSSLGATARLAMTAQGYRLSPDEAPEEVRFIRSDQFSFIRQGIPAIALGSGYDARDKTLDLRQMQRDFRRDHYHQPSDDTSLPMDFTAAADLARIALRTALDTANAPSPPRWKLHDFFGDKFGSKPGDVKADTAKR